MDLSQRSPLSSDAVFMFLLVPVCKSPSKDSVQTPWRSSYFDPQWWGPTSYWSSSCFNHWHMVFEFLICCAVSPSGKITEAGGHHFGRARQSHSVITATKLPAGEWFGHTGVGQTCFSGCRACRAISELHFFKVLNSHVKRLVCFEENCNLCNFFEKLWTLTFYTCNYDKSSQHKPATVSSK